SSPAPASSRSSPGSPAGTAAFASPESHSIDLELILLRQLRERRVRLGLIPERGRGDVVPQREVSATITPADGLDRDRQVLPKADRVHDVPAIQAEPLLHV